MTFEQMFQFSGWAFWILLGSVLFGVSFAFRFGSILKAEEQEEGEKGDPNKSDMFVAYTRSSFMAVTSILGVGACLYGVYLLFVDVLMPMASR